MIPHALVLAAGRSTRIAPLSGGLPKPLLPVAGKPVVGHALEWLAGHGVASAWINLHSRADLLREALGDGGRYGVALRYSHEPEILGTAGAWKKLIAQWSDTSLVVYGDNLMRFDLSLFLAAHRRAGVLASVALFDPARHAHSGIAGSRVMLADGGRIQRFAEGAAAASGGLVNAGAYLLEPAVGKWIGPGFQDFGRDVFPALVTAGQVYGYVLEEGAFCLGLDTPESFRRAEALIRAETVRLA